MFCFQFGQAVACHICTGMAGVCGKDKDI